MLDPQYEFFLSIGVPYRTVARWRQSRRPNPYALMLWQWFADGRLPTAGEDWQGWRFFEGELWSPEGDSFTAGDLRAVAFLRRNSALPIGDGIRVTADH